MKLNAIALAVAGTYGLTKVVPALSGAQADAALRMELIQHWKRLGLL